MLVGKHPEISVCFEKGTLRQCFFKATELAYTNCESAAENALKIWAFAQIMI